MADLKTNYKDDVLDTTKNQTRLFNIKSTTGTVIQEKVQMEDVTEYSQEGDVFGASAINETNTKVNEINNNLRNLKLKKLWENPNPSSSFSPQDITLSSNDYDYLIFMCKHSSNTIVSNMTIKGYTANVNVVSNSSNIICGLFRDFTYVNNTTYSVKNCYYTSTSTSTVLNDCLVPTLILGGKIAN